MWEVSNMQKTEQKTEQQAGLGMSFCEEEGRITVFRKTLEALEWPSHYRFLYNRKMKQIAVQACGAEEAGAHRVGKLDESKASELARFGCWFSLFERVIYRWSVLRQKRK